MSDYSQYRGGSSHGNRYRSSSLQKPRFVHSVVTPMLNNSVETQARFGVATLVTRKYADVRSDLIRELERHETPRMRERRERQKRLYGSTKTQAHKFNHYRQQNDSLVGIEYVKNVLLPLDYDGLVNDEEEDFNLEYSKWYRKHTQKKKKQQSEKDSKENVEITEQVQSFNQFTRDMLLNLDVETNNNNTNNNIKAPKIPPKKHNRQTSNIANITEALPAIPRQISLRHKKDESLVDTILNGLEDNSSTKPILKIVPTTTTITAATQSKEDNIIEESTNMNKEAVFGKENVAVTADDNNTKQDTNNKNHNIDNIDNNMNNGQKTKKDLHVQINDDNNNELNKKTTKKKKKRRSPRKSPRKSPKKSMLLEKKIIEEETETEKHQEEKQINDNIIVPDDDDNNNNDNNNQIIAHSIVVEELKKKQQQQQDNKQQEKIRHHSDDGCSDDAEVITEYNEQTLSLLYEGESSEDAVFSKSFDLENNKNIHDISSIDDQGTHTPLDSAFLHDGKLRCSEFFDYRRTYNIEETSNYITSSFETCQTVGRKAYQGVICILFNSTLFYSMKHSKIETFPIVVRLRFNENLQCLSISNVEGTILHTVSIRSTLNKTTIKMGCRTSGFDEAKDSGYLQEETEEHSCFSLLFEETDNTNNTAEWNLQLLEGHITEWCMLIQFLIDSNSKEGPTKMHALLSTMRDCLLYEEPFHSNIFNTIMTINTIDLWRGLSIGSNLNVVGSEINDIAEWLHDHIFLGIDRNKLTVFLEADISNDLLKEFIKRIDFIGQSLPTALRHLINYIDYTSNENILYKAISIFSKVYYIQNEHLRRISRLNNFQPPKSTGSAAKNRVEIEQYWTSLPFPDDYFITELCLLLLSINDELIHSRNEDMPEGMEYEVFTSEIRQKLYTFRSAYLQPEEMNNNSMILSSIDDSMISRRGDTKAKTTKPLTMSPQFITFLANTLYRNPIQFTSSYIDKGYDLGRPLRAGWIRMATLKKGFFKKSITIKQLWVVLTQEELLCYEDITCLSPLFVLSLINAAIYTLAECQDKSKELTELVRTIEQDIIRVKTCFLYETKNMKLYNSFIEKSNIKTVSNTLKTSNYRLSREIHRVYSVKKKLNVLCDYNIDNIKVTEPEDKNVEYVCFLSETLPSKKLWMETIKKAISDKATRVADMNETTANVDARRISSYNEISVDDVIIEKQIAIGSMGTIYKGVYKGKEVAIKRLNDFYTRLLDEGSLENKLITDEALFQFKREADLLQRLNHPNIVSFVGCYVSEQQLHIVTEYCTFGSLRNVLDGKKEEFTIDKRLKVALHISQGLEYLHECQLLHRDIKSLNVVIDSNWIAKLTDFGLTRKLSSSVPTFSSRNAEDSKENCLDDLTREVGTMRWTAPECLLHHDGDKLTPFQSKNNVTRIYYTSQIDIYSLGMTFYELITGYKPFHQLNYDFEVLEALTNDKRPSLENANAPQEFLKLIEKCWATIPSERPTASEIVNTIRKIIK